MRFNPPPNWPRPPHPGWQPPRGWRPDPRWGPPPRGWRLWVDDVPAADPRPHPPVPQTAAPSSLRGKTVQALSHPLWITVGTLVTATAVLLALLWPNGSGGGVGPADAAKTLEVEKLSFDDPSSIDAVTFQTSDQTNTSPTTTQATPVDITLRNNGGTPIRIIRIETKVLEAKTVTCNFQGGGLAVSAFYSVKIPYNPWLMELTSDTVSSDVDFTVQPKSGDRMVVTIGPEESGNGTAIVLAVSLKLIPETGDPVVLEPLALTQPEAVDQEIRALDRLGERMSSCKHEQAGLLDGFITTTRMQSPDLLRLRNAFDA